MNLSRTLMAAALCLSALAITFESCSEKVLILPASEEELGEKLFFDPILSRDSTISCASCHRPENAFADRTPVSTGVKGRQGTRNTPSAMNQTDRNNYFWDGRAESLEDQALGPIENHVEMDLPLSLAIRRLERSKYYNDAFIKVTGARPTNASLALCISAYERTLETSRSPFDKYMKGDSTAISESAIRGLAIFNGKGRCFDCHFGVDFTGGDKFKNIGLYDGKKWNDVGRFSVTHDPKDLGRFKIPGLRNIAMTAPYMHNGSVKTLKEVIEFYDNPDDVVPNSINRDTILSRPLHLTDQEKKDLENFLLSLTDERFSKAQ